MVANVAVEWADPESGASGGRSGADVSAGHAGGVGQDSVEVPLASATYTRMPPVPNVAFSGGVDRVGGL
ncbi:MAG: hypothetical protein M3Z25_14110 [Actinomycetota bacterium]|nr:hypothetical protein [Actinomycetota bacterium]